MGNDYLNMVNEQVRDASRWVKDYKANPDQYGSATSASSNSGTSADLSQLQQLLASSNSGNTGMMGMFQSMMMLLMFQILSQQLHPTSNSSTSSALDTSSTTSTPAASACTHYPPVTSTPSASADAQKAQEATKVNTLVTALEATDEPTQADIDALKQSWTDKGFTQTQFGQTAMYIMHQGDNDAAASLELWLPALFQSETLNPLPFTNEDYLNKLPENRSAAISNALAATDLRYSDNTPMRDLITTLLDSLPSSSTETPSAQGKMTEDLLYRLADYNPDSRTLGSILTIAGFTQDTTGKWQGPYQVKPYDLTLNATNV